jgi:signal transduction histidine kinase
MRLIRTYGDVAIGVLAAAIGIAGVLVSDYTEGPVWANVLAMLVYGGLLAARQRFAVSTAYGFLALSVLFSVALLPPPRSAAMFFGLLLFSYTAGTSRRAVLAAAFMPALMVLIVIANQSLPHPAISDYVFPVAVSLAAYGAGRNSIFRSALAAELHEATLRAEEAHAAEERRAVAGERRRLARAMHDVVAHSISVMVVQAGGARRILDRDPERAIAAAAAIERTGRETLVEMRRLLGVMHGDEAPAELEPSPTLADLRALCAGRGATLQLVGHPRPVPSGLEMGAYRVVQEGLDDVHRAVPGTVANVVVTWSPTALSISVADDRPYAGSELVGVRERVALYDGELRIGPRPEGGGHQLDVRFPLHHPDPADDVVPASQGAP